MVIDRLVVVDQRFKGDGRQQLPGRVRGHLIGMIGDLLGMAGDLPRSGGLCAVPPRSCRRWLDRDVRCRAQLRKRLRRASRANTQDSRDWENPSWRSRESPSSDPCPGRPAVARRRIPHGDEPPVAFAEQLVRMRLARDRVRAAGDEEPALLQIGDSNASDQARRQVPHLVQLIQQQHHAALSQRHACDRSLGLAGDPVAGTLRPLHRSAIKPSNASV